MLKYEYALYEENGEIKKFKPELLNDINWRVKAKTVELWDKNLEIRLFPRFRKDCPHFYSLTENRKQIIFKSTS